MKNKKSKCSKGVLISSIMVILLVVVGVFVTMYVYTTAPKTIVTEKVDGGSIYLTYNDDFCGLTVSNLGLLSDANGMSNNIADFYFDFTIATELEEAQKISYEISIVPDKNSTVDDKYVKAYLEKQSSGTFTSVLNPTFVTLSTKKSELGTPKGSMVLYSEEKTKSSTDNYRLRLWVSDENLVSLTEQDVISYKIVLNGKAS